MPSVEQRLRYWRERATNAEAELAQIKAQDPVAWMYVNEDGECEQIEYDRNISEEDYLDPSITLLYASPVSDSLKAECERYRIALEIIGDGFVAPKDAPKYHDEAVNIARASLKGDSNDKR